MTAIRTWDRHTRRWVNNYPRTCRTCGIEIARPVFFCEQHAPVRRDYLRRWQHQHAEHLRRYQRERK